MLFSDIEGSTRLLWALGDDYGLVLSAQRDIVRSSIHTHRGHEMGTEGDSFFVVFSSTHDAVTAGAEMQRELSDHAWPQDATVRVRMGIESGRPVRHEDGYIGMDIHRAARIASAASGGQVLIGAGAYEEIANTLSDGLSIRDLGLHRLKDIPDAEHIYQLVIAGLQTVTTSIRSLGAPSNLPPLPAALIGRDDELAQLISTLESGARLVSLTGPGGIGKTSVAIALAHEVETRYPDGVYFVGLEDAQATEDAWTSIGSVLNVRGDEPISAITALLADRRCLLVLDNLEQLKAAHDVVGHLLDHTGSAFVATSRGPLRLRAEHEVGIGPLPLPDPEASPEMLPRNPAVALFVREAQRVKASFSLTADSAPHVTSLCAQLEGLPLAIELAAAQLRMMNVQALVKSVEGGLALVSRDADRHERQRTLSATVAWSVNLLTPELKSFFARLGVFAGGADLAAAAAVLELAEPVDALPIVEALLDVSLVTMGNAANGEVRLTMLRPVRDFAVEALVASGAMDEVGALHARFYLTLVQEADEGLRGPDQLLWRDRLDDERNNFNQVFDWARRAASPEAQTMALSLATALGWYWYTHGQATEGRARIVDLIDQSAELDRATRARALHSLGVLEQQQGDNDRALVDLEAALQIWRTLGDSAGIAKELNSLGTTRWASGDYDGACALLEESAAIAIETGDEERRAATLSNLGLVALSVGEPELACARFADASEIDERRQDNWALLVDECNLGTALAVLGRRHEARRRLIDIVDRVRDLGDSDLLVSTLEGLAITVNAAGDTARSVAVMSGVDAIRVAAGIPRNPAEQSFLQRVLAPTSEPLPEAEQQRAKELGASFNLAELVAFAVAVPPTDL
ncbi:MAG: hypothetical protein QOE09_3577 [Ilumatobacteraceae bacterium]|jgi:predicted ATPase/class 3 adenylate cyclase